MQLMAVVIKVVGYIWLTLVGILILICIGLIWKNEGFSAVQETLSPFNIVNWAVTIISLAPGYGLITLSDKLKNKKNDKEKKDKGKVLEAFQHAQNIVNSFGEYLKSEDYPGSGNIVDTKKLPYDKEAIKDSLIICIKLTKDQNYKNTLKAAYTFLADFQDGVGENSIGIDVPKPPEIKDKNNISDQEKDQIINIAKAWTERRKSTSPFIERAENERIILANEVANI